MSSAERPHSPLIEPSRGAALPHLAAGAVHVWRLHDAGGARELAAARSVLDPTESRRADRLDGAAAARFITTRGALRHVLAAYLDVAPGALRFQYGPTGKPWLPAARAAGIAFSVTHTERLALITVARTARAGVDAERLRPRRRAAAVARRVFAPATCLLLERLAGEERTRAFHHAWTLREAHVKALGTGVFSSPDTLPLDWPAAATPRLREELAVDGARRQWTVAALEPVPGCIATVIAEGVAAAPVVFDARPLLAGPA